MKLRASRIFRIIALVIGIPIVLLAGVLIFFTFWLTPQRLSKLVSEYAGQYIEATVTTSEIDFKIWSTFPNFEIAISDAMVVSTRLTDITPAQRATIPADADTLASFKIFRGSINPFYLLFNKIDIRRVNIDGLALNLVALNDSVTNYDIVPPSEEQTPFSMPRFTAKEITLTNLRGIRYYSAITDAGASLMLTEAQVTRNSRHHDQYRLLLAGNLDFEVRKERVLNGFPFRFDGNMEFGFNPFSVKLDKYDIQLANLKSKINLTMDVGDTSSLSHLDYSVSPFSVLRLLEYMPASWLPELSNIQSDIMLEASVRMNGAYKFSDATLPSFTINLHVPDSWLRYTLAGAGTYNVHNIAMNACLNFNGNDVDKSTLKLSDFTMAADGVAIDISGLATNIFGAPDVSATVAGNVDFSRIGPFLPLGSAIKLSGLMTGDLRLKFNIDDITNHRFMNIDANGEATVSNLRYENPSERVKLEGRSAKMTFGSNVVNLGKRKVEGGMLAFKADVDTIHMVTPDVDAGVGGMTFSGGMTRNVLQARAGAKEIFPFGIRTGIKSLRMLSMADSMRVTGRNISLTGALTQYMGEKESPLLHTDLSASMLSYRDAMAFGRVKDASATLNLHLNPKSKRPNRASRYQMRYDSIAKANPHLSTDSIAVLARASRKGSAAADNSLITLDLDNSIKSLLRRWDASGSLKGRSGVFASYLYPTRTLLSNLDMGFSLDSVVLRSLHIKSQSNALNLTGSISNLRRFMLGSKRTPVNLRLNVLADTLSLNEIAGTYEAGQRLQAKLINSGILPPVSESEIENASKSVTASSSDTIPTVIVPSNIDAEINIRSRHTDYTNLHIYDLGTRLLVKESALNIDSLVARTDFGSAYLNLLYSSRDINDLMLSLDLGFDRIDVVLFFERFQALLAMMPDMSNLSGFVSAKMAGSMRFFPNMDLDLPSVRAVVDVRGNDLMVHQNEFIRHLARMLLIRQKEDLKIENMVVQASIHDNLLELYPFVFQMPKYKLGLMGENDFNGNMYYHISVLKSPIPFKFGINIKGNFDKYKIRFGGAKYKSDQATRLVHLVDERRINLVNEMKGFIHKLVHKAALSDVGSPHVNLLRPVKNISGLQEREKEIEKQAESTQEEEENLFPLTPIRVLLEHKEALKKATEQKK